MEIEPHIHHLIIPGKVNTNSKIMSIFAISAREDMKSLFYRAIILLIITFGFYSYGLAQKEKNNIYLFDCTGSMITNGLWDPAREALDATISTQAKIPGTEFIIIPFGDEPYPIHTFESKDYSKKKDDIIKAFGQHIKNAKYTRISNVLEAGFSNVDEKKENRIYLLTDGQPNQGDTPEKVAETINRWCASHKDTRLFYVALTNGVVNPVIQQAIDLCPDAFVVQCQDKVIPQIADISSDVYTNLVELSKPLEIEFSLPGKYTVIPNSNDSLFDVKIKDNAASEGKITLLVSPKEEISEIHQKLNRGDYEFPVIIQTADSKYFIANPKLTVHVADEIPAKLTLGGGEDEIVAEGTKWHDAFLWSKAAPEEVITWNLNPIFENQLKNSSVRLKFSVPDSKEDYKAWWNGEQIKNGYVITLRPDESAELSVQFDHDAKTGKRYFELTPVDYTALDMINQAPAEEYQGISMRTTYTTNWNPLSTALFWVIIGVLAFLVIWYMFLQRVFFPRIKMGKVEITGPDSYYVSKKLKGARKVVFTHEKKKQNIFSRLFTGEVRYVKADHFNPEVTITPSGGKKKVKVTQKQNKEGGWEVYPSTIFKQYDRGSLKHKTNSSESHMDFS